MISPSPADGPEPPGAPTVEVVARTIQQRRVRVGSTPLLWAWYTAAFGAGGLWLLMALAGPSGASSLMLQVALVASAAALSCARLARTVEQAHIALAAKELDCRAVGPLIEALEWPDKSVRAVARLRLTCVLPELAPSDAGLLSRAQRTTLYDHLTAGRAVVDPEFVLAVLRALPAVGDAAALPYVETLATMRCLTSNVRAVREAARACLPRLEERVLRMRLEASGEGTGTEPERAADPLAPGESSDVDGPTPVSRHADEVLRRVEEEMGKPPQLRVPYLIASWVVIVPFSVLAALRCLLDGPALAAVPFALLGVWASRLHRMTLTARHRRIARELAELQDVRAIGRLAEAIAWPEPVLRAGALAALTRLLPGLRANHTNLLTPYQRECLYRALNQQMARSHPDFVVALLKALEQIGDRAAVGPVQQLANGTYRSARQAHVKDAANECLPHLLAAAQRNHYSLTLLRPAALPGTDAETLLRPAACAADTDPELLLRPSSQEAT